MPAERYFLPLPYSEKANVLLEDQEFHHLVHVMRGKPGEFIEIVNGKGTLATALIQKIEKRQAILQIEKVHQEKPGDFAIIMSQALPRINRLDFIVEKGTELGMTQLRLFPGERSERKKLTEHQLDRLKAIAVSAMKQCGRLFLPQIEFFPSLIQWGPSPYPAFFGDVTPSAPPLWSVWKGVGQGMIFFVGPESGFSENEKRWLIKFGALGVKLHPYILRTDTASLAALSLISHRLLF